jgi:hypothetical protein
MGLYKAETLTEAYFTSKNEQQIQASTPTHHPSWHGMLKIHAEFKLF